jgi:hypothetical protein
MTWEDILKAVEDGKLPKCEITDESFSPLLVLLRLKEDRGLEDSSIDVWYQGHYDDFDPTKGRDDGIVNKMYVTGFAEGARPETEEEKKLRGRIYDALEGNDFNELQEALIAANDYQEITVYGEK